MDGIDLFCSDMDGTLIDATTWRPGARDFVRWVEDHRIRFAFCSSRPASSLRRLAEGLPASALSAFGGSELWLRDDSGEWACARSHGMPPELADSVRDLALEAGVQAWDYVEDGTWVVSRHSPEVDYEIDVLGMEPTLELPSAPLSRRKVQLASAGPFPDDLVERIRARIPGVVLARSHERYLEVTAANGPQDKGIRDLADLLDTTLERVAAMGDQANDAGMLRAAGHPFALPPLGGTEEFADAAVPGDDVYGYVREALAHSAGHAGGHAVGHD